MVKPFSPRELVARVKAVLNRTMPKPAATANTMTFGELTIDTASHTVRVSGEDVALTPKEFDLLVFLASNKGIALSRKDPAEGVELRLLRRGPHCGHPRQDAAGPSGQMPRLHCHCVGHRLQIRSGRSPRLNG